jgi:hypothetical protein
MTKYYCCSKCKVVGSYVINENNGDTTFNRGEWLSHNEFITTGFKTENEAKKWLEKEKIIN